MRHRKTAADDLVRSNVDHEPARDTVVTPTVGDVGLRDRGYVGRPAIPQSNAVEMATVLRGEARDERRFPQRAETVALAYGSKAGEQRIDEQQSPVRAVSEIVHVEVGGV